MQSKFVQQFKIKILILLILLISTNFCFAFDIEEVAEGIYVHYGVHEESNKNNKGDIANIGFIVGQKSIMVIDTGGSQKIGKNLLKKIREISKLPISHIIITHSHPDHFFGTEEFLKENAKIIGHEKLNRSLLGNFNFYKNLQFTNIGDEMIKKTKLVQANFFVKTNDIIDIDLGKRIIKIKAWESGHTDNDLSVYDTNTKTLWSENIFIKRIPSIQASVLGWIKNLEETLKMDIKLIVPGHGIALEKKKAIEPLLKYFKRIVKQIRSFHANNKSLQESINIILQNEILDAEKVNRENWTLFTEYHYSNVTKVYTELEWE